MQLRVCRWLIRCIRIRQLFFPPPSPPPFTLDCCRHRSVCLQRYCSCSSKRVRKQCNFPTNFSHGQGYLPFPVLRSLNQPHLGISRISRIHLQDLSDTKGTGHSVEERRDTKINLLSNRSKQGDSGAVLGVPLLI